MPLSQVLESKPLDLEVFDSKRHNPNLKVWIPKLNLMGAFPFLRWFNSYTDGIGGYSRLTPKGLFNPEGVKRK